MIDTKYNRSLSLIFSNNVLRELALKQSSRYFSEIVLQSGFLKLCPNIRTYFDFFESLFDYLGKNYRNEYVYKNTIINKILLGKYSLNTSSVLEELRVGNAKADLVILNGTSNVYEVKTKLDNLDRLDSQLREYLKFFDKIYVVIDETHLAKIQKIIPCSIGIMVLTKRLTISLIRESEDNKHNVDPMIVFDTLRKNEYCSIIKNECGSIPKVPNTQLFIKAKENFMRIQKEKIHDHMVNELKNRSRKVWDLEFVRNVPKSLKMFSLSNRLSKMEVHSFREVLNSPINIQ